MVVLLFFVVKGRRPPEINTGWLSASFRGE